MFLKTLGIGTPLALGALYVAGAFGGGAYSRVVDRPQAEVMRALEDLDIADAPGEPGTDPSRSGGVTPITRLGTAPDRMTWTVMSGQQIATQMTAIFEPIDAGRTRVTAVVERGDAPDDFTSPAFRNERLTMALFGKALEDELNILAPKRASAVTCAALFARLMSESGFVDSATGHVRAMGADDVEDRMRLTEMEVELANQGCDTSDAPRFNSIKPNPSFGDPLPMPSLPPQTRSDDGTISFEPDKPMVDLDKYSRPSR